MDHNLLQRSMRVPQHHRGMVFLVDHYDSFTWNLRELLEHILHPHVGIGHYYYDDPRLPALLQSCAGHEDPEGNGPVLVVLAPGPKAPQDVPSSLDIYRCYRRRYAFLGVCLGHQIMGLCEGFALRRASSPVHGSTRMIHWHGKTSTVFSGVEDGEMATYNSLALEATAAVNPLWEVVAWDERGDIAVIHRDESSGPLAVGTQFHPESFLSSTGPALVHRFVSRTSIPTRTLRV